MFEQENHPSLGSHIQLLWKVCKYLYPADWRAYIYDMVPQSIIRGTHKLGFIYCIKQQIRGGTNH